MTDDLSRIGALLRLLAIIVTYFGLGFLFGRLGGRKPAETHEIVKVDTVVVFDTIVREGPVFVASTVIRYDTVELVTVERDTVEVEVPIERKVYEEDSLYRAVVSGYRASLDTLVVWPRTTTITIDRTKVLPAPRWSFGATAGPSLLVSPRGRVAAGVGVTAGVTYRF